MFNLRWHRCSVCLSWGLCEEHGESERAVLGGAHGGGDDRRCRRGHRGLCPWSYGHGEALGDAGGLGERPEAVEPVPAAEGGRADCPADWYVYNDPDGHFSMCYPPDWSAKEVPPQAPEFGWGLHISSHGEGMERVGPTPGSAVILHWRYGSPFSVGCAAAPTDDGREEMVEVAGRQVVACQFEMPLDEGPEYVRSLTSERVGMRIPYDGSGYLEVIQGRTATSIDLSRIVLEEPLTTLRLLGGE